MAAKVAASVVWLTADTAPTTGLTSALAAVFAGLVTGFDSDFLFVTEAFNCTGTAFAATLGKGFAFDGVAAALVPALGTAFGAALEDFSTLTPGFAALVLPAGLVAAVFFRAGLAADLAAAGFAFFAEGVRVFAGFVIALAMESTIKQLGCSCRAQQAAHVKPIYAHFNGWYPPAQYFPILFARRMKFTA